MPIYNSNENALMHSLENAYRDMKSGNPNCQQYIIEMDYQAPTQVPQPTTGQQVRTAPQPETRRAPTGVQRAQQNMQQMRSQRSPQQSSQQSGNSFSDQYFAKNLDKANSGPEIAGVWDHVDKSAVPNSAHKYFDMFDHQTPTSEQDVIDSHNRAGGWGSDATAAGKGLNKAMLGGDFAQAAYHAANADDFKSVSALSKMGHGFGQQALDNFDDTKYNPNAVGDYRNKVNKELKNFQTTLSSPDHP